MAMPAPVFAPFIHQQPSYTTIGRRPQFTIQPFPEYGEESVVLFRYELTGTLLENRRIRGCLPLTVVFDPEEVVISEPAFHMHASAPTFPEAVQAFRETLSDYMDLLEERRETLGRALQDQLAYLHSVIEET